ncbi:unnamed protein product [Mytilus coruscus]|uniref:Uncharacterized protein n=1 Tax=Mytilus coruscus TaxID=42192 RepID=A0A6J8BUX6_MYTCO|nr:unnamed protein product [Mytilus coruscus]
MDSNGEEEESYRSLYNFLQGREVDVNKLKEQKIDCKVILEMDDRELSKFIPSVGDLYTATGLTLLTFYILLTPVKEESLPKLSLPKKSVKIDEQHEKEQTDEKEQDENDLTHSVGTDIIAEAVLSSGVADFDGGDSLDSIPDFFEDVAFLEPENIDVPGDFSMPVEEPVTLNVALTQNQD